MAGVINFHSCTCRIEEKEENVHPECVITFGMNLYSDWSGGVVESVTRGPWSVIRGLCGL